MDNKELIRRLIDGSRAAVDAFAVTIRPGSTLHQGPVIHRGWCVNAYQFRTLLDWFMASDPWPLRYGRDEIRAFLNREATKRGYRTWREAHANFPLWRVPEV